MVCTRHGRKDLGVLLDNMESLKDEKSLHLNSSKENTQPQSPGHFLAQISHELRTPLTMIIGQSDALQEGLYGSLNPDQLSAVEQVTQSGIHLLKLIDSILDYNQFSSGSPRFNPAEVAIGPIIHAALQLVEHLAAEKQIVINHEDLTGDLLLEADEVQITQILVNLLDNAIKFTPVNGQIWIKASPIYRRPDAQTQSQLTTNGIEISVQDSGVGIEPEEIDTIFDPFVQGSINKDERQVGFGLGLSIVQQMVVLHNGSVSVESEPGRGSRFILTLPMQHDSQNVSQHKN